MATTGPTTPKQPSYDTVPHASPLLDTNGLSTVVGVVGAASRYLNEILGPPVTTAASEESSSDRPLIALSIRSDAFDIDILPSKFGLYEFQLTLKDFSKLTFKEITELTRAKIDTDPSHSKLREKHILKYAVIYDLLSHNISIFNYSKNESETDLKLNFLPPTDRNNSSITHPDYSKQNDKVQQIVIEQFEDLLARTTLFDDMTKDSSDKNSIIKELRNFLHDCRERCEKGTKADDEKLTDYYKYLDSNHSGTAP